MLRAKRLNDDGVATLKPAAKRLTIPDPELRGHYVRVMPTGTKSFWAVARDPNGKQIWRQTGAPPMPIADAREKAMAIIRGIRSTVVEAGTDTASFESVARNWFERHAVKNGLRTEPQIRRLMRKHLFPAFAGMNFADVRRRHVATMLDRVEDECGAAQADHVLGIVRNICSWYAKRDDSYDSPIIKGMDRSKKTKRPRVLNDIELKALWAEEGTFGNLTKFALLTAQRKAKLYTVRWSDIRDGVWHIQTEAREKGNAEVLPLPATALAVLENQRTLNGDSPFVFALSAGSPNARFHRLKMKFVSAHDWPQWQFHDLRRSARSLMTAAGVSTLHAELVLGHAQQGVAGIYDRHSYLSEKGEAVLALANKIRDIVTPPPENVRTLHEVA